MYVAIGLREEGFDLRGLLCARSKSALLDGAFGARVGGRRYGFGDRFGHCGAED